MTHVVFEGGPLDGRTMLLFEGGLGPTFFYSEEDAFAGVKPGWKASIYVRQPKLDGFGRVVYKA